MPEQVGRRVYAVENPVHDCCPGVVPCDHPPVQVMPPMLPGDYGCRLIYRDQPPSWECYPPGGNLGTLGEHEIVEHADGTISVSPSILELGAGDTEVWHGYLTAGVWRW